MQHYSSLRKTAGKWRKFRLNGLNKPFNNNIFLKSLHDPLLNQGCINNDRIKIIFGHGQLYFSLEERCIVLTRNFLSHRRRH